LPTAKISKIRHFKGIRQTNIEPEPCKQNFEQIIFKELYKEKTEINSSKETEIVCNLLASSELHIN